MTAEPQPNDLSNAFGRPAAASLRGLLPPRQRRGDVPAEPEPEPESGPPAAPGADTDVEAADETPAPRGPRRRPARTTTTPTAAGAGQGTGNRRWGPVRLSSLEHVELLVLVALRRGPADGREIAERLRHDSGGGLTPPPTTVQRTVHHLARHGLVERDTATARRRYRLTEPGRRAVRARVRAWQALRRAVDAVVRAADED